MSKRALTLALALVALAGPVSLVLPTAVRAQTIDSDYAFKNRMEGYIRRIESDIDRLRAELDPEGSSGKGREPGSSANAQDTSVLYELDQMEDALDEVERDLDSMSMMPAGSDYEIRRRRMNIEYYVDSIDRRLRDIRAELRRADKVEAQEAEKRAAQKAQEEEISNDSDWAEDWARGED